MTQTQKITAIEKLRLFRFARNEITGNILTMKWLSPFFAIETKHLCLKLVLRRFEFDIFRGFSIKPVQCNYWWNKSL